MYYTKREFTMTRNTIAIWFYVWAKITLLFNSSTVCIYVYASVLYQKELATPWTNEKKKKNQTNRKKTTRINCVVENSPWIRMWADTHTTIHKSFCLFCHQKIFFYVIPRQEWILLSFINIDLVILYECFMNLYIFSNMKSYFIVESSNSIPSKWEHCIAQQLNNKYY